MLQWFHLIEKIYVLRKKWNRNYVFSHKNFSSFYTSDDNKAYTCLCLSKSDAIEPIKNARCESSLRCWTDVEPNTEYYFDPTNLTRYRFRI